MPIYELECKTCNKTQEILVSYDEYRNSQYKCNLCNQTMIKIVTVCNFKLKGEGFYKQNVSDFD